MSQGHPEDLEDYKKLVAFLQDLKNRRKAIQNQTGQDNSEILDDLDLILEDAKRDLTSGGEGGSVDPKNSDNRIRWKEKTKKAGKAVGSFFRDLLISIIVEYLKRPF